MRISETALPIAILLCFSCFTPSYANPSSTASNSTTAGLRIQLDKNGKVLQHTVPIASGRDSAYDADTSGSSVRAVSAPATTFTPTLVRSRSGAGTVVRLNGRFRAASKVHIDAHGKLQSECTADDSTRGGIHN